MQEKFIGIKGARREKRNKGESSNAAQQGDNAILDEHVSRLWLQVAVLIHTIKI